MGTEEIRVKLIRVLAAEDYKLVWKADYEEMADDLLSHFTITPKDQDLPKQEKIGKIDWHDIGVGTGRDIEGRMVLNELIDDRNRIWEAITKLNKSK